MADFENSDFVTLVINEIDDSVSALPYPIAIRVSHEFLGTFRARINAQCLNSLDDTPTIGLCT